MATLHRMEFAKLVLLCLLAICGYGAAIGSVSSFVCPEAFTLGHPPAFEGWPAPALGPVWGILDMLLPATATGMAFGIAANIGHQPMLKAAFFRRVLPGMVAVMAIGAVTAGTLGYLATRNGYHEIIGPMRDALPAGRHPRLAAVWWATLGSLVTNFAAAIILAAWTWRKRAYFGGLLAKR